MEASSSTSYLGDLNSYIYRSLLISLGYIEKFITGGFAGAVAKTVIAPGDRVKILYQVTSDRPFSLRNALKTARVIVERGGFFSLWRGHSATLLRIVPFSSISYGMFPIYQGVFGWVCAPVGEGCEFLVKFVSGSAAGASATVATYPLDLLRARFAAHWDPTCGRYPSYLNAVVEVAQLEGARGLYAGLLPTLAGIVPYAGLTFALFGAQKRWLARRQGCADGDLPVAQRALAGGLAGWLAQTATYPLEVTRRRMQVHPARYPSMRHTLRAIVHEEGARGLFKGVSLNWIKSPLAVAISLTVNDLCNRKVAQYHEQEPAGAQCSIGLPEKLVCGATATTIAKLWTIPYDRHKLIYSVAGTADSCAISKDAYRRFKATNGAAASGTRIQLGALPQYLLHCWRGSGGMMAKAVPYGAVAYGTFDLWSTLWQRLLYTRKPTLTSDFLSGACAASLATVLLHPLDVFRTRNTVTGFGGSPVVSYRLCMINSYNKHGIRGLFIGIKPALFGIAPMAGFSWAFYELLKRNEKFEPKFTNFLVAGSIAGLGGQILTYPLNIIRRRATLSKLSNTMPDTQVQNKRLLGSVRYLFNQHGLFHGLYRRMPLGWVFSTASISLSFALNDTLRCHIVPIREYIR